MPHGVVYLAKSDAPAIAVEQIPSQVIHKIKALCGYQLRQRQTGFGRDGKGLKFADYYWMFFDIAELMDVAKLAACRIIPSTKPSSAAKRSASLTNFQTEGELPTNANVAFGDDYRIDRLAEFGDTLCRGIWRNWGDRFNDWQKQQPKAERKALPALDLMHKLAEQLGLAHEIPTIREIQVLKKTGGVPLDWYYLAANYIQQHPDLADQHAGVDPDDLCLNHRFDNLVAFSRCVDYAAFDTRLGADLPSGAR